MDHKNSFGRPVDKPLSDLKIETLKKKRIRNIVLFLVLKNARILATAVF